jgi:hypothetical protein
MTTFYTSLKMSTHVTENCGDIGLASRNQGTQSGHQASMLKVRPGAGAHVQKIVGSRCHGRFSRSNAHGRYPDHHFIQNRASTTYTLPPAVKAFIVFV